MVDPSRAWQFGSLGREMAASAAFLTRIPADWLGVEPAERPNFRIAARAFPLVGALVGAAAAAVLLLANAIHLPPLTAALLAIAATIGLTGALHEDGLADTADGFGGGRTLGAKLEIMRDSRIGSYGAAALILSIGLRTSLIAAFLPLAPLSAALALIAAETVSRAGIVHVWASLPTARIDGLAGSAGRPSQETAWAAVVIAIVVGLIAGSLAAGPLAAMIALAAAALATYLFEALCRRQIAGQTGDTLGASQQIVMIVYFLTLVAFG